MDSPFLGKWELQMFGDSGDSCTAGVVQLFGEFCNMTQLGLLFPNLSVHPALAVGSSWIHIISALRNELGGGNLEGWENKQKVSILYFAKIDEKEQGL